MTSNELVPREKTRTWVEAFDRASDTYDAPPRRFFRTHAQALVREAGIPEGARVLDVATGTGHVACEAVRAVGPRGRVVGVDLAAGMLARAREKATGLPVEFRQMDAEALEFDDGAFDVVLCGFAVSFLTDAARSMREMRRVLRKGGTVAVSTFTRDAFQPQGRIMASRFGQYGIFSPPPPAVSWQVLREPEHLMILLEEGGFEERRVVRNPAGHALSAADEYWDFVWGNGYWQKALGRLEPEALARLRAEFLADIEGLRTDKGIWVDTSALFGIGVKP